MLMALVTLLATAAGIAAAEKESPPPNVAATNLPPMVLAFCAAKEQQVKQLAAKLKVEVLSQALDYFEAAKKGVELTPQSDLAWLVLGWANYRVGEHKASIAALEKSISLNMAAKGGSPSHWFFLAMANWQLGNKGEARRWYDQAIARMDKLPVQDGDLQRIRVEAEEVLEIKKK